MSATTYQIRLKHSEGSLVRLLGLARRRRFDVTHFIAHPSPDGDFLEVQMTVESDRSESVLARQIENLLDVAHVSIASDPSPSYSQAISGAASHLGGAALPISRFCAPAFSATEHVRGVYPTTYLLLSKRKYAIFLLESKTKRLMKQKTDVLQGTLALMVLKTLDVLGTLHGYGIARRIEQISGDLLAVNQGTLYPVLLKLEQEGAIASEWGTSENNRRARFYRLTRDGRKQLQVETQDWEQTAAIICGSLTSRRRICHEISKALPQPGGEPGDQARAGRPTERRD